MFQLRYNFELPQMKEKTIYNDQFNDISKCCAVLMNLLHTLTRALFKSVLAFGEKRFFISKGR